MYKSTSKICIVLKRVYTRFRRIKKYVRTRTFLFKFLELTFRISKVRAVGIFNLQKRNNETQGKLEFKNVSFLLCVVLVLITKKMVSKF